jgi:hypothetical protein
VEDFKVIIKKHDGSEDDEHTYWGSVFIMPDHIRTKELDKFDETTKTVSTEFSFPQDIMPEGKQFVACVYGYDNDGEILNVAECQIGKNTAAHAPEVIEFARNP